MRQPESRLRKLEHRAGLSAPTHAIIEYDPGKPGDLEAKQAAIEAKYPGISLVILPTVIESVEEWQEWVDRDKAKQKDER